MRSKGRLWLLLWLHAPLLGQEWLRYRGPGDLLPPQLGGVGMMADLTHWNFAWEFLRDDLQPAAPMRAALAGDLLDKTAAAMLAAMRADDEELALLSLWGLARIAPQHARVAEALRDELLGSALQRPGAISEVAALALGLAAYSDKTAVATLAGLANDTRPARALVRAAVPERMRCFALYGLGLCAERDARPEVQFGVLAAVEKLLLPDAATEPQVRIAALHALALVRLDRAATLSGPALQLLEQQWLLDEAAQYLSVRAQVPLAAAAMLRAEQPEAGEWRERFVTALQAQGTVNAVRRSCAQALGRLCRPFDGADSPDAGGCEALRFAAASCRDLQTQNLCVLALGMIGGRENLSWLAAQLSGPGAGSINIRRPWVALGLGCGFARRGQAVDAELAGQWLQCAQATRPPRPLGGVAAGIGLARVPEAGEVLLTLLRANQKRDDAAAPLCAALAAVDAKAAAADLRELAATAGSAELVREAMLAYRAVGGEEASKQLRAWLLDPALDRPRRYAAAQALRGDAGQAVVQALLDQLQDAEADVDQRRLAAFAIGSLCDGSSRHWSAKLAATIDYRGATPVLVGAPNGVLRLP